VAMVTSWVLKDCFTKQTLCTAACKLFHAHKRMIFSMHILCKVQNAKTAVPMIKLHDF